MFSQEKLINPDQGNPPGIAVELAMRGNRRRLRVFLMVFIPLLLAGFAYTFARPPEYRAQASIAVKTAGVVRTVSSAPRQETVTTAAAPGKGGLSSEAGVLTSRPVIDEAVAALRQRGIDLPEFGVDPVPAIQSALTAESVADTNIISLAAVGPHPAHLADILNALIDVYTRRLLDSYSSSSSGEIEALRDELARLNLRLAEKRKALEEFRQTADIVSSEREENQILARVKGLSNSLNLATDKVAQAEGRVRSIRESLAAGKTVVRSRDNPTLAALETRASQLREALREQERVYTPQFLAMDPNVRGMRSRLADLEKQITEQKAGSGQMLVAEAEEELASARQAQQKLQAQIADDRRTVHVFSRNFSAYKSMEQELAQIEASRSSLSERLLRTETSERSRKPSIEVVEEAIAPQTVWRPDYLRDAAISVAAALVVALGAMALVELFNRPPPPSNAPVIVPQSWIAVGHDSSLPLPGRVTHPTLPNASPQALLPGVSDTPRLLSQEEIACLLQMLPDKDAVWATLLLCGATPEEIHGISPASADAATASVRLQGSAARELRVPTHIGAALATNVNVMPGSDEEVARCLLCAAHDAGLDEPAEVTAAALRHTCIAYLVGQGLRFSELDRIVGLLPADTLAKYAAFAPPGTRRGIAEIDPIMPALVTREAS